MLQDREQVMGGGPATRTGGVHSSLDGSKTPERSLEMCPSLCLSLSPTVLLTLFKKNVLIPVEVNMVGTFLRLFSLQDIQII